MTMSRRPEDRTRMFARVLGPYLVIVAVAALARASQMGTLLNDFGASSAWPWVTGAFVLLSGLVVVALHQNWRGAPAIIVTVMGWLATLKGLALLAFPQPYISFGEQAIDSGGWWWRVVMVITALAGLYLTFVGWAPARLGREGTTTNPTADLPHAA